MKPQQQAFAVNPRKRVQIWYGLIVLVLAVCLVRLFYIQIIRHEHYQLAAQSDQYKEYEIAAPRGLIKAHDGSRVVPIVLNHTLYTLYVDPELIKDVDKSAATVQHVLGGDAQAYADSMQRKGRYVILAKKVTESQKAAILKYKLAGIGVQAQDYRTYPQGVLAAQLLGFVDDSGTGRYGLEQALNKTLTGQPGQLKAVTDINGVPLAASEDNIRKNPTPGHDLVLTIDIGMQQQAEQLLKQGLDNAKSQSGSVVILDSRTGAVKAMANYPTYNPGDYTQVNDAGVFNNAAATDALEVGSVMKPLTAAAALSLGVVKANSTYYDQSKIKIEDATVSNIEEDGGPGTKTIPDILNLSLNTGATWLLQQMGGGELNKKGRVAWYDYMTKNYRFGESTGIEQGNESSGVVPSPTKGYGLNITYANTSFGQAMTATMLQMAGAYAAMLNGGTYYQPHLVESTVASDGTAVTKKPKVLASNVVSGTVSKDIQSMLEYVVDKHHFDRKFDDIYSVGGKTGTAQIADPAGGYLANEYNGTYIGFVGGDEPEYIIAVRVDKPKIAGYAGSQAAQPIFGLIAHMLIDNFNVTTKTP
jgi:stage V sporulation protein D (sporulation-specific penicillin-binding protein)